jgi:hypothetical protein
LQKLAHELGANGPVATDTKIDEQPKNFTPLLAQAMCLDSPELSNVQNVERLENNIFE